VPTAAPSVTAALRATPIEPRCVSVIERPSPVSIVTDLPLDGTVPAKLTTPDAGARTGEPADAAMSTPRCCSPAYGCAGSNAKDWTTVPPTGHVHAPAAEAHSRRRTMGRAIRRSAANIGITASVVRFANEASTVTAASAVVKMDYSEPR
jgi:hypothetical protein